jgi:PAS domain S-box-containing protein
MRVPNSRLGTTVGLALVVLTAIALEIRDSSAGGLVATLFMPAIMVAAYLGGARPGVRTTVACAIAAAYLCEPIGSLEVAHPRDVERIIAMLVVGITISVTFGALHRSRLRTEMEFENTRKAAARLTQFFTASSVAKSMSRLSDRVIVDVNPAYLRLFGVESSQVIGRTPAAAGIVVGQDARDRMFERVRDEGAIRDVEVAISAPNGAVRFLQVSSQLLDMEAEQLVLTTFVDITASKQAVAEARAREAAESLARSSEDRFRELAESIQEVFWLIDIAKHELVYISPVYEKVWGKPCSSLALDASAWLDSIHDDDRARVCEALRTRPPELTYEDRYRIVRPDGSIRWIQDKSFPVRDENGTVIRIAGVAADITDQVALQDKLQQTQKLESIGLLAGGIAHDFNNILCVITANSEMLAESVVRTDDDRELIEEIATAAQRASSLTRQLLAFGRKQVVAPVVLDLNDTVEEARRMLRRVLGEDVTLRVSLDPDVGRVCVDPGQILQVLMNLCVNAQDAMRTGGEIVVETRACGNQVMVSVSDSGPGMSAEVKARAFEPFFTTKGVGKGTGLGLAVVHGIVEQAGGTIELDSRVGAGTTVRIKFPIVAAAAPVAEAPAPREGGGRILLVDDDPQLRTSTARMLELHGYEVAQATDGADALTTLRRAPSSFDLLITDVVMPVMSGSELGRMATLEFPTLKVLYTSGYTDDEVLRRGIVHAQVDFLEKPFGSQLLRAKVRDVLDGLRVPPASEHAQM